MLDVVIEGSTIVDGTGGKPFVGDIGIKDGIIQGVGDRITTPAHRRINMDGCTVTPGFIDVHTHYDGQVTWDSEIEPSSSHGVTTAIMGNCGVGFAPVRAGEETALIELMEGVEDIPGIALHEGMPWGEWETFPEYLDFLAQRSFSLDIGAQIPHGPLRTFVMGTRGENNEAATAEDIENMAGLVEEAIRAGALGFSSSRILGHRSLSGKPVPGTFASSIELMEIAKGMARAGPSVFALIPSDAIGELPGIGADPHDTEEEIDLLASISQETSLPVTFSLFQLATRPEGWRRALAQCRGKNSAGARLNPQISSRPPGILVSFSAYHPFMLRPTYDRLSGLPLDEKVAALSKPDVRAAILSEGDRDPREGEALTAGLIKLLKRRIEEFYVLGDPIDYEPDPSRSIGSIAKAKGIEPEEVIYDELLKDDGRAFLMLIQTNYCEGNHEVIREMLLSSETVSGLGDGGAHVKLICDASMPTHALQHWARDRSRGPKLDIEFVVKKMSSRNADLYNLTDRGVLKPGYRADINVIDMSKLKLHAPRLVSDLPAGSDRLLQDADGIIMTLVNGQSVREYGVSTGARPGALVRGNQRT